MDSRREVARAPSAWRRVITAAIGLALIGLGASVIAYIATSQSDDPQADLGYLVGGYGTGDDSLGSRARCLPHAFL